MFVIPSEFDGDVATLEGYAATHSMVVALANYGSPSGGLTSAGRSAIWSASGDLLAQLPSSGSGVAVVAEADEGWRTKSYMVRGQMAASSERDRWSFAPIGLIQAEKGFTRRSEMARRRQDLPWVRIDKDYD